MNTNRRGFLSFLAFAPVAASMPTAPAPVAPVPDDVGTITHVHEFPEPISGVTAFNGKLLIVSGSSAYIYDPVQGVIGAHQPAFSFTDADVTNRQR